MNYVLGFLFDQELNSVVLIQKNKPEWQAGKLNGVGGKIERNESPLDAMRREFLEETGIQKDSWKYFGALRGTGWNVKLFTANDTIAYTAASLTKEKVILYHVDDIVMGRISHKCISNVPWLVRAAMDCLINPNGPKKITVEY